MVVHSRKTIIIIRSQEFWGTPCFSFIFLICFGSFILGFLTTSIALAVLGIILDHVLHDRVASSCWLRLLLIIKKTTPSPHCEFTRKVSSSFDWIIDNIFDREQGSCGPIWNDGSAMSVKMSTLWIVKACIYRVAPRATSWFLLCPAG